MSIHLKIFLCLLAFSQAEPLRGDQGPALYFDNLSINDGLSQVNVLSMMQDELGFMWFGTMDGLNMYDGYQFKIYRHNPNDSLSLSNNRILCMTRDSSNYLWFGTDYGLNRFSRKSQTFKSYTAAVSNPGSLTDNYISDLYVDEGGVLWIGSNAGLDKYLDADESFVSYNPFKSGFNEEQRVTALASNGSGKLWVGTSAGLFRFDTQIGEFISIPELLVPVLGDLSITSICNDGESTWWFGTNSGLFRYNQVDERLSSFVKSKKSGLINDHITSIYKSGDGKIWVGTAAGLHIFKKEQKGFDSYVHDSEQPNGLSANSVLNIYQDRSGIVWISTEVAGVDKLNMSKQSFRSFLWQVKPGMEKDNLVYAFNEDEEGNYWVGTNNGVVLFDRNFNQIRTLNTESSAKWRISDNRVRAIENDHDGNIWIGSYSGVDQIDPNKGFIRRFKQRENNSLIQGHNQVITILADDDGELWLGTNGGGIERWQKTNTALVTMRHEPGNANSLPSDYIRVIRQDNNGLIWIGTYGGGLCKYDKKSDQYTHYKHVPGDKTSLSGDYIYSIHIGARGGIWVGAYGSGLNYYDVSSNRFYSYSTEDGLPNDVVYGILESSANEIWISTNKGLSHLTFNENIGFNTQPKIRNYGRLDGLQSDEFNFGAYMKNRAGLFFFGGVRGFNVFNPGAIRVNKTIPDIVLTDFKVFNKTVSVRDVNSPLEEHISTTKSIELSYNFNAISFEFAALHFINPYKNKYAYMLRGQDKDWIYSEANRRFAHYSNLEGGDYVFRVRAANSDGVWNDEGVALRLKIIPPFWETSWFQVLTVLALLALTLSAYNIRTRSIRKRNRILKMVNERLNLEIRKKETAQKSLRASEENYHMILENSPIGIFHFDKSGNVNRQNQMFFDIFNLPSAEKINLYSTLRNEQLSSAVRHCLDEGFSLIEIAISPDESLTKAVRIQLNAIYEHDHIIGGVGIAEDTSERNRAQTMQEIVYRIARGMSETETISDFYELIRFELSKILDTINFFIGFYKSEDDTIQLPFMRDEKDQFERLPASGTISDLVIKNKKPLLLDTNNMDRLEAEGSIDSVGSPCKCWMGVPLVVNEEVIGIIVVQSYESETAFSDSDLVLLEFVASQVAFSIKEKQAQEEIRKLSLTIEQSRSSIIIAAIEGEIEYANPVLLQELRLQPTEVYKLTLESIFNRFVPDNQYQEMMDHVESGKEWRKEVSFENSHERKWHYIVCSPVLNDKSITSHVVLAKEDISNTKILQEQLNQAQKMESIGNLAGGIAHDFNNLLTVINGHAEIALLKINQESKAHKDIVSILHAGKRAENLTRQLLAFSRRQLFQAKILDLNHLILNMEKMLTRLIGEDISVELNLDNNIPTIKADPGQIEQIIMNLVINARDALRAIQNKKAVKTIIVKTRNKFVESGQFSHEFKSGEYVLLEVLDNGTGMELEIQDKIFEPFFTTKGVGKGTGLGLATVYGIVKQNMASIEVDSEVGKGTAFTIYWPAMPDAETPIEHSEKKIETAKGNETVLLVEDEEQVRQFAKEGLESSGYTVLEAANGVDAIKIYNEKSEEIDLLITDLVMPEMSGSEVAAQIKTGNTKIRIIITSGYSDEQASHVGDTGSDSAFLQKPYSLHNLLASVRKVLDQ